MDLTTRYLGLELRNPLVASAGPLTSTAEGVQALADAGVGAVVLPSVFEEQLRRESDRDLALALAGTESQPEAAGYLPGVSFDAWPHEYLRVLEKTAGSVGIPVIASLNGVTPGGWMDYADAMQAAGAAAIELNVYYLPGDPLLSARAAEIGYAEMLTGVKAVVSIPVAVKMAPYSGAPGETASILDHAGADGLVLFNRFLQTDIDPETLTVSAGFRLSSPGEATLPRAWISLLRGRVRCSLAASTGVETAADVAAYLLAGADVVMTTSALLRHGPGYVTELLDGVAGWMERKGFATVTELRGLLSAEAGSAVPGRTGYLAAIEQATRTFSCGTGQGPAPR
jgi:dihydroorotate dehydrogenase (fumarate)